MFVPFLDFSLLHGEIEEELISAFSNVLRDGSFILGDSVSRFEREFGAFLGDDSRAVGVGNGTDAIEIALRSLELPAGSTVLVPANSFVASAIGVVRAGLKVRFVDVDERTLLAGPNQFADQFDSSVSAIMPVHLYGNPAEMDAILEFASAHSVFVVEDAAQAHGAKFREQRTGTFGHASAFSFYPGKNLGALGDGGAVVSKDALTIENSLAIRNLGSLQKYDHTRFGFNSRLDSVQAAALAIKLPLLDEWNHSRRRVAEMYRSMLEEFEEIGIPELVQNSESAYHLFPVLYARRDDLAEHLKKEGIQTLIHYPQPIHLQTAFKEYVSATNPPLEVVERAAPKLLSLPIFPGMNEEQIEHVVESIARFLGARAHSTDN